MADFQLTTDGLLGEGRVDGLDCRAKARDVGGEFKPPLGLVRSRGSYTRGTLVMTKDPTRVSTPSHL